MCRHPRAHLTEVQLKPHHTHTKTHACTPALPTPSHPPCTCTRASRPAGGTAGCLCARTQTHANTHARTCTRASRPAGGTAGPGCLRVARRARRSAAPPPPLRPRARACAWGRTAAPAGEGQGAGVLQEQRGVCVGEDSSACRGWAGCRGVAGAEGRGRERNMMMAQSARVLSASDKEVRALSCRG